MGSLKYRMTDPGYTFHHRAGLCGLADTVASLIDEPRVPKPYKVTPDGDDAVKIYDGGDWLGLRLQPDGVEMSWGDDTTYEDAMRILLGVSFQLTDDGIVYLPGKGIDPESNEAMLAEHDGCMKTLLSASTATTKPYYIETGEPKTNKKGEIVYDKKTGEPKPKRVRVKKTMPITIDEVQVQMSYTPISWYAHQDLPEVGKREGFKPGSATRISQALIPGADATGDGEFRDTVANAILLRYVLVSGRFFDIRFPKDKKKEKATSVAQYHCIVMPDPADLDEYVRSTVRSKFVQSYRQRYTAHYAAGVEEAMLRFGVDYQMAHTKRSLKDFECYAVWVRPGALTPIRRLGIAHCRFGYSLDMFETAVKHFGNPFFRRVDKKKKKGEDESEAFVSMPPLPIPEWIASNLVNGRHWCHGFASLPGILYKPSNESWCPYEVQQKGFNAMIKDIREKQDDDYIALIQACWRSRMAQIRERLKGDCQNAWDSEKTQIINELNRRKTYLAFSEYIQRFIAKTNPGNANVEACRRFMLDPDNYAQMRNLTYFAFSSYMSNRKKPGEGDAPPRSVRRKRQEAGLDKDHCLKYNTCVNNR